MAALPVRVLASALPVPVVPDGAFYAWADCSAACERLGVAGSWELAFEIPTLEPRLAGLTKSGAPSASAKPSLTTAARARAQRLG